MTDRRQTKSKAETRHTFCRLCEGACGISVHVADDRVLDVEPDPLNPLSRGFICIKGKNSHRIVDDPARILAPQRQRDGRWMTETWESAFAEIGAALTRIKDARGPDAIALYIGNPSAMSSTATYTASAFLRSLGSTRQYSAMSLDNTNKFVVAELMFGDKSFILQRDWEDAAYMLLLGTNPRVSIFGQLQTRPRGLEEVRIARGRGARLVLVDPRRTETATIADEHLAITPGTDTFFLLALIATIIAERLYDAAFIDNYCHGLERLRSAVAEFTAESVAACTNIPAEVIRRVAREFAHANGAFALGNTGLTQQRHATVNEWAISALNAMTGNIDRAGGAFYNPGVVDEPHPKKTIDNTRPSRIGNYPRVLGEYPASTLADEILTPGKGQIRALIVVAGNPLATGVDTDRLRTAFKALELLVVVDLFRSTTAELAHWLLPATTFYERKDLNIQFTRHTPFPFIQHTDRMVEPRGQAREEWEIFRGLHAAVGTPFLNNPEADRLATERGAEFDVDAFYSTFLKARGHISLEEIKKHPHGVKLGDKPIGAFRRLLERRGMRIDLLPAPIRELLPSPREVTSLSSAEYPLLMVSRRNLRSVCSWFHIGDAKDRSNYVEMNARDADRLGVAPGSTVRVRSATGEVVAPVKVTDEIREGVVSLQYGLDRQVRSADGRVETTMNRLVAGDANCDRLTGMPTLNGIPVRITPIRRLP
jgi:anaerobic selenocysteine-containing dehydrogenase